MPTFPGTILVFDLGTSYFKATLFDTGGTLKALARVATPYTNARAPYSELSVPAFDAALLALAHTLQSDAPDVYAALRAVTFSSQTNTFALFDTDRAPLTPFVAWNDRRADGHDTPLDRLATLPDFYATTGVPALSAEFMVAKLHWYQEQTPELWERVAQVLLISDYLTWRFTGQSVTEAGAAGLTGLVNIHDLQWWADALDVAGIDRDLLPDIARAGSDLGTITPEAARAFHLPAECRFVVGCLDQYAGALGAGNIQPNDLSETTGTVLATVRCATAFEPVAGSPVFWGPAAGPGHYYQMIFGDVSANLLEAFRNALAEPIDFEQLGEAAVAATGDALTLPRDLDTPALLAHVRHWAQTEPIGAAVRAILDGVAAALAEQIEQLCGENRPAEVHSVGGAARSKVWMQIKANTLGLPVRAVACPEPTSLGAAMLALHGLTGAPLAELVARCVRLESAIEPE